jgi:hypothetical protein
MTGFTIAGTVLIWVSFFCFLKVLFSDKHKRVWLAMAVITAVATGISFWIGNRNKVSDPIKPRGYAQYDEKTGKTVYRDESRHCHIEEGKAGTFVGPLEDGKPEPEGNEVCQRCGKRYKSHVLRQLTPKELDAYYDYWNP